MKAREILIEKAEIIEGGSSGGARYNTEIGTLLALAGNKNAMSFDPNQPEKYFDKKKLGDPERVFREIKTFLVPHFDETKFWGFYKTTKNVYPNMTAKMSEWSVPEPALFGWAGGSNQSDDGPADVEFLNHPFSGISIKDTGGITLSNLTPKHLGLSPVTGEDLFYTYAKPEFQNWKESAIKDTLAAAKNTPDQPYSPMKEKYSIRYNSETQDYAISVGSKEIIKTQQELYNISSMLKNQKWHRVFGDHLQANKAKYTKNTKALATKISKIFELEMEEYLGKENRISKILQYGDKPYFYLTPKKLYYVPSFDDLDELVIKGITFNVSDGTSMRFITKIGHPDSDKSSEMDIYVRYRNGLFSSNPTGAVQSLKNPEHIFWEPL